MSSWNKLHYHLHRHAAEIAHFSELCPVLHNDKWLGVYNRVREVQLKSRYQGKWCKFDHTYVGWGENQAPLDGFDSAHRPWLRGMKLVIHYTYFTHWLQVGNFLSHPFLILLQWEQTCGARLTVSSPTEHGCSIFGDIFQSCGWSLELELIYFS